MSPSIKHAHDYIKRGSEFCGKHDFTFWREHNKLETLNTTPSALALGPFKLAIFLKLSFTYRILGRRTCTAQLFFVFLELFLFVCKIKKSSCSLLQAGGDPSAHWPHTGHILRGHRVVSFRVCLFVIFAIPSSFFSRETKPKNVRVIRCR